MRICFVLGSLVIWIFASACSGGRYDEEADHQPQLPEAPWMTDSLDVDEIPETYVNAWRGAANREDCALIAPDSVGSFNGVSVRRANFSGGWGVAYDLPEFRSAFGVAGTGAASDGEIYSDWPNVLIWADGSIARYGPEGGTGPNQLAYLQIAGQDCLYNVWSRLGVEHLELLLDRLRRVPVDATI